MPEIPLLQPTVLRGVVEKFTTPENLVMLSSIPRTPYPYPTATWDVLTGSRTVAKPNVPNAEAHIVPRLGRSQQSASFVYLREKKVFEPTTLHWLREPGTLAARNAEAAVLREVGDLNQRLDNFVEKAIWSMFTGSLSFTYPEESGGATVTIDYQIPASHKPTVGTSWDTATPQQIIADIRAWKRLIARDGRVPARDAWVTEATLAKIFEAFASDADTAALISDRQKDAYYTTGMMPGFMGLNWRINEAIYEADNGDDSMFLPDNSLILGNFDEGRPYELYEGPSADDEAPSGYVGKFTKTWKDKDPSARQVLLEYHCLPVLTKPEQFVYVADVTND